jgi:hypothetical protein
VKFTEARNGGINTPYKIVVAGSCSLNSRTLLILFYPSGDDLGYGLPMA